MPKSWRPTGCTPWGTWPGAPSGSRGPSTTLEKDTQGVNIAFQLPLYPMLDDRDTETSRDNHAPVWNTRCNHYGWGKYLRGLHGETPPYYAAPARREDYTGLPPAYTFISTAEPFYAETIRYVENLRKAGVPAEVDVYPGLFHAFDMLSTLPAKARDIGKSDSAMG